MKEAMPIEEGMTQKDALHDVLEHVDAIQSALDEALGLLDEAGKWLSPKSRIGLRISLLLAKHGKGGGG